MTVTNLRSSYGSHLSPGTVFLTCDKNAITLTIPLSLIRALDYGMQSDRRGLYKSRASIG
jgi:hypothetical protein